MEGHPPASRFYFVHSFFVVPRIGIWWRAPRNMELPLPVQLPEEIFFATQFHPEKSAAVGQTA